MKTIAKVACTCCLAFLCSGLNAQKAAQGFRWDGSESYGYNHQTLDYYLEAKTINKYGSNGLLAEDQQWYLDDSLNQLIIRQKTLYAYDGARNNTGQVDWLMLYGTDSLLPYRNWIMTFDQDLMQTKLVQSRDIETGEWIDRQLITYQYNDKRQNIRQDYQTWDGVASWINRFMNTFAYNADGDMIRQENWAWNRVARDFQIQSRDNKTYNRNHEVVTDSAYFCMNQEGTEWYLEYTLGNIYNSDGLLTESHEKIYVMDTASLMGWYKMAYTYNDKKQQTDVIHSAWIDSTRTWFDQSHVHASYDEPGNQVKLDYEYWESDSGRIITEGREVYLYSQITGKSAIPIMAEALTYPNPVTDRLTLMNAEPGSRVQLLSSAGRLVLNQTYTGSPLDLSTLPAGLYTLRVTAQNGILTRKIVKQ